ncbi:hypothetical protein AGIG_G5152 [Arapaima gigas]
MKRTSSCTAGSPYAPESHASLPRSCFVADKHTGRFRSQECHRRVGVISEKPPSCTTTCWPSHAAAVLSFEGGHASKQLLPHSQRD